MRKPDKTLIVVVGPTAIGKTDLAIRLAQNYHTEIISADSRQFFREMEIGTAKPSEIELKAAKHHFINSQSIDSDFSVGDFEQQALQALDQLYVDHDQAILVGGSGLYVKAVCEGFDDIPKASEGIREKLNSLYADKGIETLRASLIAVDPEYSREVDLDNPQRLIRALEVFETTGRPFSSYRIKRSTPRSFQIIKIGLNTNREELYEKINRRVDVMMQNGLLEEAQNLLRFKGSNALNTVGYSELFDYLEGKHSLEDAITLIKQNTRRFAKRQLTWFKRQDDINWFKPGQTAEVIDYINHQLNQNPEPSA